MSDIQCPHCGKEIEVEVTPTPGTSVKYFVQFRFDHETNWRQVACEFGDEQEAAKVAWDFVKISRMQSRVAKVKVKE